MTRLFINVDHVATVRQARQGLSPDPIRLAAQAEAAGADGITMHLREDRRHVQDEDVRRWFSARTKPFNFELATHAEIVDLCEELGPEIATLVPERREEVTTEGGLDLEGTGVRVAEVTRRLRTRGTSVSLFIDPDPDAVSRALDCGATHIELHTGSYAHALGPARDEELRKLERAGAKAMEIGLRLNAGHGLDYENVGPVAALPGMEDLNIGHAIVARALETGMSAAVVEMRGLIAEALKG